MIYLASQSPRRQELLQQINIPFQLVKVNIDETPGINENPGQYVIRMAREKALHACQPDRRYPLLAADTSVIFEQKILGKPRDKSHFMQIMALLSQQTHQVMTAIAVCDGHNSDVVKTRLSVSEVTFRNITRREAQSYWDTGEPCDKAGGYAIQGRGAVFISEMSGSFSGVMGLPLYETAELLSEFGVYSI